MNPVCPIDNKDDAIQKVSAIVASDILTDLGKWLARPTEPSRPGNVNCLAVILAYWLVTTLFGFVAGGAIALWAGFSVEMPAGGRTLLSVLGIPLVIIGIAGFILFARFFGPWKQRSDKSRQESYNTEKSKWDGAMATWGRLYYCRKHDIVFDPRNGEHCPPASTKEFIYKSTEDPPPSPRSGGRPP